MARRRSVPAGAATSSHGELAGFLRQARTCSLREHEQPRRASRLPHMASAAQCPRQEQPRQPWRASEALIR